ncbi:M23 family metallopeptidase [Cohnella panacarvi]|uniref:M23 family metallopeptidase n=1 Tax=Cohnella panacarvi TaxID=400776 RepID=UPI00047D1808|nr:M23 family metallopeptidase [Cohnella panacarvi]
MQTRNNARDRRRERIQQLITDMQAKEVITRENHDRLEHSSVRPDSPPTIEAVPSGISIDPQLPAAPQAHIPMSPIMPSSEPDPELWWKEKQRSMNYDTSNWAGMKGLKPTSRAPEHGNSPGGSRLSPWARGMMVRLVISGLLFAGMWGWMKYEIPGSAEARAWVIDSLTNDMDFEAIEAWYSDTFGGSPSFLSFSDKSGETKEVAASLNREDTVLPVQGRIVQTYEQSGNGVQVAAPGGSDIVAVYAGRVIQVQAESENGLTILVQHPDRILSVYGNLQRASVKENDWVEAGDKLGELQAAQQGGESKLYFAMQQNGKKLNPTEVVSFD